MTAAVDLTRVDEIIARHPAGEPSVIPVLLDLQAELRYLDRAALERLSETSGVAFSRLYGLATFYRTFSLVPKGRHICKVCMGTPCHVKGAPTVVEEFERSMKVEVGHTSEDGEYSIETVGCMGACAMAPVVVIDDTVHGNVEACQVQELVDGLVKEGSGTRADG